MGGFGSGRGYGMQTTVEDCLHIDIRFLKKTNRLRQSTSGSLGWTRGGRKSGSINYDMHKDRMVLKFRHRPDSSSEWKDVTQAIYIETTACNYGGSRKWFTCPNCAKRVGVLYSPSVYFYCRKCYKLPYRSTLETKADRLYSKKHALGEEIFQIYEGGEGYFKKKGMHYKTFNRKLIEYRMLESRVNAHCQVFIDRLNGKL